MTLAASNISAAYPAATPIAEDIVRVAIHVGAHPYDLANLIRFESGNTFSPSVRNAVGATGLIQFYPRLTKESLGVSVDDLARMTGPEQMAYVEKYLDLQRHGRPLDTPYKLYMAVFYPAAMRWKPTTEFPAKVQEQNAFTDPRTKQRRLMRDPSTYVEIANRSARLPTSETAPPVEELLAEPSVPRPTRQTAPLPPSSRGPLPSGGWPSLSWPSFELPAISWPTMPWTREATWSDRSNAKAYLTAPGSTMQIWPGPVEAGSYIVHVDMGNGAYGTLKTQVNVEGGKSYALTNMGGRWQWSIVQ